MMTALGRAEVLRTYFTCPGCGQGGAHVDRLLGLGGFLTRQATRLVCLTGGRLAFAAAGRMLAACCGRTVSDETLRRACQGEAGRIAAFHATPAAPDGRVVLPDGRRPLGPLLDLSQRIARIPCRTPRIFGVVGAFVRRETWLPSFP